MYHGAAASFWFLRAGASVGIVCSRSLVRSFVPTAHLGVPSLLLLLQVTGEPLVRRPDDTAEASRRRQCAATIASEVFTSRSTPIAPRSTCTARSLASSATAPTCKEPTLARGTTSPLPRTQYCTRHSSRSSCCYTRLSSTSSSSTSFVHLRPPSSDGTHPRLLFLLPPTRHSRSLP